MINHQNRFITYLHKRKRNPSPAAKIGIGLLFAVISFFIFAFAALHCHENSSLGLLSVVIANFFLGLGELCVLPVAISAITQWAPVKFKGTMMGLFFLALAFSGYLAGLLAKIVNAESHGKTVDYTPAFLEIGYITLAISLVMFCLIPWFRRLLPSK